MKNNAIKFINFMKVNKKFVNISQKMLRKFRKKAKKSDIKEKIVDKITEIILELQV